MNKSLPNRAIEWQERKLILLDQRRLPAETKFLVIDSASEASNAIRDMVVRGAPAIGITAGYGVVLSAISCQQLPHHQACEQIERDINNLAAARPTAVNLHWALQRMRDCLHNHAKDWLPALEQEAIAIQQEDIDANKTMGRLGAQFLYKQCKVMTHCNAGALATGGYGTALGVIRTAFANQKLQKVVACETRPWLQGSRLTAWELTQEKIPVELICDSAAASVLRERKIDWVIVGADRVAANGDVANKIGTCGLAILARHLGTKFMVVAPSSTFDLDCVNGDAIKIEVRQSEEVTHFAQQSLTSPEVSAWNPVFDITPANLIDVLVCEKGVIERPNRQRIAQILNK